MEVKSVAVIAFVIVLFVLRVSHSGFYAFSIAFIFYILIMAGVIVEKKADAFWSKIVNGRIVFPRLATRHQSALRPAK